MVDVIITCQSRRKILYTIGLGFILILASPTGSTRWPQKLHPAIQVNSICSLSL